MWRHFRGDVTDDLAMVTVNKLYHYWRHLTSDHNNSPSFRTIWITLKKSENIEIACLSIRFYLTLTSSRSSIAMTCRTRSHEDVKMCWWWLTISIRPIFVNFTQLFNSPLHPSDGDCRISALVKKELASDNIYSQHELYENKTLWLTNLT